VLLEHLRAQAHLYGAAVDVGTVDTLERGKDADLFTATVGTSILTARTVLLATGVVENKSPVRHLADAVKSGLIRTCPICDGFESKGKRLAVLGNGEYAAGDLGRGLNQISVAEGEAAIAATAIHNLLPKVIA